MDNLEMNTLKEIANEQYRLLQKVLPYLNPYELGRLFNDIKLSLLRAERYAGLLKSGQSSSLAASTLGKKGGKSTSTAKRKASAANGRLGGRPKKQTD
jgi:hypothetical protein